jgi:predicted Zn-dependent peptidase
MAPAVRFYLPVRVSVLSNGVRVITAAMPHVRSVSVGVWIGVGSRHESDDEAGASHFLEHLLFKGSDRLSAKDISESIEGVGGQVNAFTSEEVTCCFAAVPSDRLPVAMDVMAEMFLRAACRQGDIGRERGVILDELSLYRDQPQSAADEALNQALWPRHPLGRPVPGLPRSLKALTRSRLLAFRDRHYVSSSTVIAASGDLSHEAVVRLARRAFGAMPAGTGPAARPASEAGRVKRVALHQREIEQSHLALGFATAGYHDRRRYALRLLNVVLGENTSSRLFQRIREAEGLAYSVQSGVSQFSDCGALTVTASTDVADEDRVLGAVVRECRRLGAAGPSPAELARARDYVVGQARMGLESTVQCMTWLGEHTLMYGRVVPPSVHEKRLASVTVEDVRDTARSVFARETTALAVVGPGVLKRKADYLRALGRLD